VTVGRMTSRDAVLTALTEYDRLGQDGFLEQHGYGKRTRYALVHQGRDTTPRRSSASPMASSFRTKGRYRSRLSTAARKRTVSCDSWASRLCWSNR
jgi:hypothetical protein